MDTIFDIASDLEKQEESVQFNLENAHPEHAEKIESIIRGLMSRYPWVPLKRVELYQPGDEDDHSLGNADQPGIIQLNSYWFSQDPEILQQASLDSYIVPVGDDYMGWHGNMVREPEHVICHEFAHIAADAIPGRIAAAERDRQQALEDPDRAPSGYAFAGANEYGAEEDAQVLYNLIVGMDDDLLDDLLSQDQWEEQQHPRNERGQFTSLEVSNSKHLEQFANQALPRDTDTHEYFYHAASTPSQLENIAKSGIKPAQSGNIWLSKNEIRDKGGGYVIAKIPRGQAKEGGPDVLEPGLSYRQWITRNHIPPENIHKVVKFIQTTPGGHGVREDELAQYALTHQGETNNTDLPEHLQSWFHLKDKAFDFLSTYNRLPEAKDAEWKESEHPRASSGSEAGQFVEKGGAGTKTSTGVASELALKKKAFARASISAAAAKPPKSTKEIEQLIDTKNWDKAYDALEAYVPKINSEQYRALDFYRSDGYVDMNDCLRRGEECRDKKAKEHIAQLETFLSQAKTPVPLMLTRIVRGDFAKFLFTKAVNGMSWKERTFLSTSLNPEGWQDWQAIMAESTDPTWGKRKLVMQIEVPAGMPGTTIDNKDESEVLFNRGVNIRITKIDKKNRLLKCVMELD